MPATTAADPDALTASAGSPLAGEAAIPGDKSISHRALILGALASGETVIAGLLESLDIQSTIDALRAFAIRVERIGPGRWRVVGGPWRSPANPIDCGNSGTTARLLIGAVAGLGVETRFVGDDSLSRRPMRRLTEKLQAMGARIDGGETLPLTVRGGDLSGIRVVNQPASGQVKTALLLAGLGASGEVEIHEPIPSRDHGEILLKRFGAEVVRNGDTVRLGGRRRLEGRALTIPADPSSAAFALAAAAIVTGSEVRVSDMLLNPHRAGFLMALQRLGGDVALDDVRGRDGETIGAVRVRHAPLFAADFTPDEIPSMIDEIPALAMLLAHARGESRVHGLGELRVKESDRLAALEAGLRACGVEARVEGDSLIVVGGPVDGGATIDANGDHRIAMAFLTLGLSAARPITVRGAGTVATSFPGFAATMRGLGARIGPR